MSKTSRALPKGRRSRKTFDSSNFCEGKIKGNAVRVPTIPVCTWGYRTSKLFIAPREVDEKPYKSWRFGEASTLECALLRSKSCGRDVDFVQIEWWFSVDPVLTVATVRCRQPRICNKFHIPVVFR
jgi:hypothetical protein